MKFVVSLVVVIAAFVGSTVEAGCLHKNAAKTSNCDQPAVAKVVVVVSQPCETKVVEKPAVTPCPPAVKTEQPCTVAQCDPCTVKASKKKFKLFGGCLAKKQAACPTATLQHYEVKTVVTTTTTTVCK